MAGIVAQITKANWNRIVSRRRHLPPDKCAFYLPPFDPYFDPIKHNVFLRRKTHFEQMHKKEEEEQKKREEREKEERKQRAKELSEQEPIRMQCLKALMGLSVIAFPLAIIVFLLFTFWGVEQAELVKKHENGT